MIKSTASKIMWGLFLVGAAVLIIVNAYFEFFVFWQMLALVALVPTVIASIVYRNFGGIFLPIALLLIVFSDPLGIPISPLPILAAGVLLTIAVSIIFSGSRKKAAIGNFDIGGVRNEETSCNVNFGGTTKHFTSDNFTYGSVDCNFGGVDVYMNEATLSPSGGTLHLSLNFGSIDIYVPRDWNVVQNIAVSAGAVGEDGKCTATPDSPTLTIAGSISFGGVDIHYAY
ncbi:MAG: hypothetical protein FWF80_02835 [Defluviitaleaceae bacterium]|nr:hypothetical protein [Defluviitaleaceae bacterium]